MPQFWNDPTVIGDVEAHISALLNHVNVYTHVAWKDDPTILGWDLMNGGGTPVDWTRTIAAYLRGIDSRHLILSGYTNAGLADVNACVSFVYPHWHMPLAMIRPWMARCARAHKPYLAYEYGWDRTNYPTLHALGSFLDTLRRTPGLAGDAFWALEAHADGHGWLPIPADTSSLDVAIHGESGQWWALYYPGLRTLVSSAADMAARAQVIRRHNYAMAGKTVPPHLTPPAPAITSAAAGRLLWQGSAGAARYSVQRAPTKRGPWTTVCDRCATDSSGGFRLTGDGWYRVIALNLDGRPSPPSAAVKPTTSRRAARG
jgi:hypothetical protein